MRTVLPSTLLWLMVSACGGRPEEIPATLVIEGGHIWTGDEARPWAEALAVRGDRISAVGSVNDVRPYIGPDTRIVRVDGGLVAPGFIDSHVHFMSGGFQLLSVDLRSSETPEEMARRLADFVEELPPGTWVTGGDWDHEAWPGGELPRREAIDAFTPEHPIFVQRLDGHMALANSRALEIAGVGRDTPDPAGGTIVRDPATGEPTGVLKDAAMDLVYRVIPAPDEEARLGAARAALQEAARFGVTTVHDMGLLDDFRTYQTLHNRGELTCRIYCSTPLPEWETIAAAGIQAPFGNAWIQIGGAKGFVDGSLGSTTALFYEPYTDEPTTSGIPAAMMFPEGNMKRLLLGADRAGLQPVIHAIGDKANGIILDIFGELVEENPPRERRFRIEHAQHLRADQISRMADLDVIASMQPFHAIDDGRWAEKRIGPERIRLTYAFRSVLDAGVRLAFGSDWTVGPLDPLLGVYAAVTRRTLDDKHPDGWIPEQKISVEEALRAYTAGGAYAQFEEHRKGVLRAGYLADIVVLEEDLFQTPPERIDEVRVLYTFTGGNQVYPFEE